VTAPPQLFDPDLARMRRERMRGREAWFLHEAAAREVTERLSEVNRTFRQVAVIGPAAEIWHDALAQALPDAEFTLRDEADPLPLRPAAHDLLLHTPWLHRANDPLGVLIQSRLALKPDGLMIAALFGGRTLEELRAALAEAEVELTGGLSPRVAPMAEIRALGGLLQRAGFAMPVADADPVTVRYSGLVALMQDLRAMGETNVMAARLRRFTRRGLFARAEAIYRARWGDAEGRLPASFEIVWLTGWAPAPDQPQPLRPGSAAARLADALGTVERPLAPGEDD